MMKKLMIVLVLAAATLGGSAVAALETMPLLYDTYVDQGTPAAGYSGVDVLRVSGEGTGIDETNPTEMATGTIQQMFLQFDISSVPADATLTNAEFGIFLNDAYDYDSPKLQLWVLNNDNWDNTLTWNGSLTLLGAETTLGLIQSAGLTGEYWKWTWSDLNDWDYADALLAGKVSFLLTIDPEDQYNFAVFNSSENAENQPYLKLDYIPEPATLTLLAMGMGGLTLFRRKR